MEIKTSKSIIVLLSRGFEISEFELHDSKLQKNIDQNQLKQYCVRDNRARDNGKLLY